MKMITLICLTKAYNLGDFDTWLSYHLYCIDRIIILDNESEVDVKSVCEGRPGVEYHFIKGFHDQWQLFNDILNQKTDIKFEKDEIVTFLDDDEYLLYHTNNNTITDPSLTFMEGMNVEKVKMHQAIEEQFRMLDCMLLPEILMAPQHCPKGRARVIPLNAQHAVLQKSSQGKAFIRWQPDTEYDFCKEGPEIGHVPWINGIRMSDVAGSGVSKTTYGLQPVPWPFKDHIDSENGCRIFLLHYHIKSISDWKKMIERGSAPSKNEPRHNGSYDDDIKNDPKYHWNKPWYSKTTDLIFMPYLHIKIEAMNENQSKQILEDAGLEKQKEKPAKKDL